MSQSVEWARASSIPILEEDEDWSDPWGQQIEPGKIGIWLDEVMIEGTEAEFRTLIGHLTRIVDTHPFPRLYYVISESKGLLATTDDQRKADEMALCAAVNTARTVYVHDRMTEAVAE